MAIQMRRGNQADYDPSLLMPGEFAVSQDARKVYICFTKGTVVELAASEAVQEAVREAQQYASAAHEDAHTAQEKANTARYYASNASDSAGNAQQWASSAAYSADDAQTYARRAETTERAIQDMISGVTPAFTINFSTGHMSYALGG